jgi:protein tyrosine/serine phosphatase
VSALLLGAAGVSDTLIAEDYALSSTQITHLITEWREYAVQQQQDMEHFERDVASTPETMLSMLNYLTEHYGSITNYLTACGVSHSQLERLRTRLIK